MLRQSRDPDYPRTALLFFAAAPVLEGRLPAPTDAAHHAVVILRLRGRTDLSTTFMGL